MSLNKTPLTDGAVDCGCSITRFCRIDQTESVPQQLIALLTRHASSAISRWCALSHFDMTVWDVTNEFSVNVLTKIDNLKAVGGADLPFNLDFYTEVQDLQQLLPALAAEQTSTTAGSMKWERLNSALIELIEDFGLVGFETLAVEDKQSMASFLRAIDRASGYVFSGSSGVDEQGRTLNDEASIWAQAMGERWAGKLEVRDVQERWIDRREEFDEEERKAWEEEARLAGALPEKSAATAVRKSDEGGQDTAMDDEDELMVEQRKWQQEQEAGGGGAKSVRKD